MLRGLVFGVLLILVIAAGAWFGSDGNVASLFVSHRASAEGAATSQSRQPHATVRQDAPVAMPAKGFKPRYRMSKNLYGANSKLIWSCTSDGLALQVTDDKLLAPSVRQNPSQQIGITFSSGPGQGITLFGKIASDRKSVEMKGASVWKAAETIASFHGPAVIRVHGKSGGKGWITMNAKGKQKAELMTFVEACKP